MSHAPQPHIPQSPVPQPTTQPDTAQPDTAQPDTAQPYIPLAAATDPAGPRSAATNSSADAATAPGPAQATVPLAVFPVPATTRPHEPQPGEAQQPGDARPTDGQLGGVWTVPPLLAQQILAAYTAPGSTVLAVGASARAIARTAQRLDRRPPARGADRRAAPATVDLLLVTPAASDATAGGDSGVGATVGGGPWRRWPQLLTPTGILAVVLPPTRAPGDPAAVVAAAAGAGLTYLQHAVAVLWPLHEDHLDLPPGHPAPGPGSGGMPPAHVDVLLFVPCRTVGPGPDHAPDRSPKPAAPHIPSPPRETT